LRVVLWFLRAGFFFSSRRRHTRSKRDWSSDVCSSDLGSTATRVPCWTARPTAPAPGARGSRARCRPWPERGRRQRASRSLVAGQIGRASCRERGRGGGARCGERRRRKRTEEGSEGGKR